MIGNATELDGLSAVAPRALNAYLVAQGWRQIEPYGEAGHIYGLDSFDQEILVPSAVLGDYGRRVNEIVETLSLAEARDRRAILRDLSLTDFDLVRVRLPEAADDGSVPLDTGVTLFQEARNLLLAAACSASRPQRAFRAGRNQQASRYLQTVRLGQTEQGSFVANLLSPVPPNLVDQDEHRNYPPNEPFSRLVTLQLVSGLMSVRDAVASVNQGDNIRAFERKVQLGVSSNLCDAITNLLDIDNRKSLDVSVRWSLTRRSQVEQPRLRFTESDIPVLKEATQILKDRQDLPNERLEGYVTALARGQVQRRGRVTIRGMIDGTMSSVRVDFAPSDYSLITEAHDMRWVVSLEGDLRREGQRWVLDNPRDILVFEDDD